MLALLWPGIFYRLKCIHAQTIGLQWFDLLGFAADFLVAVLLFLSLRLFKKQWQKGVLGFYCLLLTLIYLTDCEHIGVTYAHPSLSFGYFLFDRTFFYGSVIGSMRVIELLIAFGPSLAAIYWLYTPASFGIRDKLRALAAMIVTLVVGLSLPVYQSFTFWRQTNVILEESRLIFISHLSRDPQASIELSPEQKAALKGDLSGDKRWGNSLKAKNVLLITLESLSDEITLKKKAMARL